MEQLLEFLNENDIQYTERNRKVNFKFEGTDFFVETKQKWVRIIYSRTRVSFDYEYFNAVNDESCNDYLEFFGKGINTLFVDFRR